MAVMMPITANSVSYIYPQYTEDKAVEALQYMMRQIIELERGQLQAPDKNTLIKEGLLKVNMLNQKHQHDNDNPEITYDEYKGIY